MTFFIKDLQDYDIILNKRKQAIKNWDLFQNFLSKQDLIISCEVIKEKFPEYYDDYVKILNDRYLYPYCMFVARKELVDEYCLWLFPFLQALEDNLDVEDRKIGYFAELGLVLYAIHNKLKIKSYDIEFKNLEIGFYTDIDFPLLKTQQKHPISLSPLENLAGKSHLISLGMLLILKLSDCIKNLFTR